MMASVGMRKLALKFCRWLRSNPIFFFNDTATTEIYTLSLHDALPILRNPPTRYSSAMNRLGRVIGFGTILVSEMVDVGRPPADRKSTRLNSSHSQISYAVFCLKKKKKSKIHGLMGRNGSGKCTLAKPL